MNKIIKILYILLILVSTLSFGQLDKIHYLQPLASSVYNDTSIEQEAIYLSTPNTSNITVKITYPDGTPAPRIRVRTVGSTTNTFITNGIVTLNNSTPKVIHFVNANNALKDPGTTPLTLPLSKAGTIINANEAGLIFSSDQDFFVNYRVRSANQAGSVLTKGNAALGTDFLWGGTPIELVTTINSIGNLVSIMATEDNTEIRIDNYDPAIEFVNGSSSSPITDDVITRTLQKGQSFILFARVKINTLSAQDAGWLGAQIKSNKEVVVTVGGMMQQGALGDHRDIGIDQIVPVSDLGKEYVVMQGKGISYEKVVVIATEKNTAIYLNNETTPYATLINVGDYSLIPSTKFVNNNMYIQTTKPTYVYHKIFGSSASMTNSFMFIPPLSCTGQKSVDLIPYAKQISGTNYNNTTLAVLARAGSSFAPTVTRISDGTNYNVNPVNGTFTAVPGNSSWVTYRYDIGSLTVGHIKIESFGSIQAELMGASGDAGFGGYYSGFGTQNLVELNVSTSLSTDQPCTGDTGTSTISPKIIATNATYQWYKNNQPIPLATNFTYQIPTTDTAIAEYKVEITMPDGCIFFSDTVKTYMCPCYKTPATGPTQQTLFGITTNKNIDTAWPQKIPNGFMVLDSNNKGFVITRISNPEQKIQNPIKGMLIFDTEDQCLKIYNGTDWKCIKQTCY